MPGSATVCGPGAPRKIRTPELRGSSAYLDFLGDERGLLKYLSPMLSFVLFAYLVGGYNAELRRIVVIDLAASALLVSAGLLT